MSVKVSLKVDTAYTESVSCDLNALVHYVCVPVGLGRAIPIGQNCLTGESSLPSEDKQEVRIAVQPKVMEANQNNGTINIANPTLLSHVNGFSLTDAPPKASYVPPGTPYTVSIHWGNFHNFFNLQVRHEHLILKILSRSCKINRAKETPL
jgi:hypothetical protein